MKRWLLHIWLMGVLGMLAASCSQEAEGLEPAEKQKVMLRFTIALDEPEAASRSWDGYDYEDGVGTNKQIGSVDENKINTVHAVLYDLNGVLMGKLNVVEVSPVEDSANKHVYTVIGSVEAEADDVSNMSFKLMVFANCSLPADLSNPGNLVFTNPSTTTGNGIPMWGIATYTGVDLSNCLTIDTAYDLTEASTTTKNPVYMLRSMAKIEVTLEEETAKTYSLTGATLDKVMKSGFVMPKLRLPDTTTDLAISGLTSTKVLGIDEVFNPVAGTNDNVETGTFTEIKDENNAGTGTFIIYVPEYEVGNGEAPLISLGLLDSNGAAVYKDATNQTPYSFSHGSYEEGSFKSNSDIIRNHYYKYTVAMKNGVDLEVIITIYAWIYTEKNASAILNPDGTGL